MQRLHPVCNQADMGRRGFIGQRFPLREKCQAVARSADELMVKLKIIKKSLGGGVVGGDDNPWAVPERGQRRRLRQAREHKRRG